MEEIRKQKNTSLIIEVLKKQGKMRAGDLYKEVMKSQERKYGKSTAYTVIARDVVRLLRKNVIKEVGGGPRSKILTLR